MSTDESSTKREKDRKQKEEKCVNLNDYATWKPHVGRGSEVRRPGGWDEALSPTLVQCFSDG